MVAVTQKVWHRKSRRYLEYTTPVISRYADKYRDRLTKFLHVPGQFNFSENCTLSHDGFDEHHEDLYAL